MDDAVVYKAVFKDAGSTIIRTFDPANPEALSDVVSLSAGADVVACVKALSKISAMGGGTARVGRQMGAGR
ncbi:hypothetical protein DBIPINDM_005813 [Mesorhizobium sp. AR02]|uniref:hypothetical protein n=1 Tax=Mesorhizobium sp. AR02 TaxID=2865837 RepID=UPI00215EB492|nr:hypothetical protein [Mesorhizobium sp. AR02]UVK52439.1 hypothetical protein DBIPINDM_005813 [Mesorhizobium sp. AR02]